jgi:hypothetical protein
MQWWWAPLSALTAAVWFDSNHLGLNYPGFVQNQAFESQAPLDVEQVVTPLCSEHLGKVANVSTNFEIEQVTVDPVISVESAYGQAFEHHESTDVSIDNNEQDDADKLQDTVDPLSLVGNAIWQSMELQNHVAIFTMEAIVMQARSWMGVTMHQEPPYLCDDLLVNNALVMSIAERVIGGFENASGTVLSMLPSEVQTLYHNITDSAATQVKEFLLEFQVEQRWRRTFEHAEFQAGRFLSAFQARFPKYRLNDAEPIRGLFYLTVWFACSLYLSSRILCLTLACLRKFFASVVKHVLCCPCRMCRRCFHAEQRSIASSNSISHHTTEDGTKERCPSTKQGKHADATNGGA